MPDLLPAIAACIGQPAVPVERVLTAWPMNHGMVGVRLRTPDGHRFDCIAPQIGGAAERLTGLMAEDSALPGEADPVYFPKRDQPPPLRLDDLEPVNNAAGTVVGWLAYVRGGPNDPVARIAGTWKLHELDGQGALGEPKPPLTFAVNRTLRGESGCNIVNGSFSFGGTTLKVGKLATTRRACAKPMMEQEKRYLEALRRVTTWRIDNDALVLADGKGRDLMRLTRATP